MPATLTHSYFSMDSYNKLPANIKNLLTTSYDNFILFSQGSDSLMFYSIFRLGSGKNIRKLQNFTHGNKTKDFFINILKHIKKNELEKDPDAIAFLLGNLSHYILDKNIHPFVIYKSGYFNKSDSNTYKYNGKHEIMETYIDLYLYNNKKVIPKISILKFSSDLEKLINSTYFDTYGYSNFSPIYYKSLKDMKLFLRLFRKDTTGLKKVLYKFIDSWSSRYFRFESLSYYIPLNQDYFYLNLNKDIWYNPLDKSIKSQESFFDLYNKSLDEYQMLVSKISDYLYNNLEDIFNLFDNSSYISGLDCALGHNFKYFN